MELRLVAYSPTGKHRHVHVEVLVERGRRRALSVNRKAPGETARIRERRDGGCLLTMQVAGLGEGGRWVMQFGADAEVLGPRRLRREIRRELSTALLSYNRLGRTPRGHPDRGWQGPDRRLTSRVWEVEGGAEPDYRPGVSDPG